MAPPNPSFLTLGFAIAVLCLKYDSLIFVDLPFTYTAPPLCSASL